MFSPAAGQPGRKKRSWLLQMAWQMTTLAMQWHWMAAQPWWGHPPIRLAQTTPRVQSIFFPQRDELDTENTADCCGWPVNDHFGVSVAVFRAAQLWWGRMETRSALTSKPGFAYVFTGSEATWTQQAQMSDLGR